MLGDDFVRTARAKGLHERVVVRRHVLRNALLPIVTLIGPATGFLVTSSFWPSVSASGWRVAGASRS